MSGNILDRDLKILCTCSGNRCAICKKILVIAKTATDRESLVAAMAHIKAERPGFARYDVDMADKDRNAYVNLILICPSCHKEIDDQPNTYTVEKLYEIKQKHEAWIIASTNQEVVNVTFAELSVVTKYIVSGQAVAGDSLVLIPPKEKISKNGLSQSIEQLIIIGMTQVRQVGDFISKCPDIEFGDRLRQGFMAEYDRLKNSEQMKSDDLFNALLDFSSAGSNDFKQKAAGLAILVYLFEKCEVFEK